MKKLSAFLTLLLAGMGVAQAQVVDFSQHVAPIVYQHCTPCHRTGEIAPFPLTSYAEVSSYASMIGYVTGIRYMPPWKPDPSYSHFLDENTLTAAEIQTIQDWVAGGAVRGDSTLEPPVPVYPTASQLGTPDLVVKMAQPYTHLGNNNDEWRVFVLPTNLPVDKDIAAIEVRTGNKRVTHHSIVAMDTTGQGQVLDAQAPGYGYPQATGFGFTTTEDNWGGWTPGNKARFYPSGIGKKLYAGADLLVQMHYGPTALTMTDSTTVNIFYANTPVTRYVSTYPISPYNLISGAFVIPPNQVKTFHGRLTIPSDKSLISMYPHAHLLGKSWEAYAVTPANDTIKLIRINDWDFKWQSPYRFPNLVKLPAGTQLHVWATYDNTAANPNNPNNPPIQVTWGESTHDEMYLLYAEFVNYQTGDELTALSIDRPVPGTNPVLNRLYPPAPNPASSAAQVGFSLSSPARVTLGIYDNQGRLVRTLLKDQTYPQGYHQTALRNAGLAAGLYHVRLTSGSFSQSEKLMIAE